MEKLTLQLEEKLGTEVVKLRDILKWNKDHTVKYGLR